MRALGVLLLLVTGLASVARADIPVMGVDENGNETVKYYSPEQYAEGFAQMISSVDQEAVPALNYAQRQGRLWRMRTLTLGVGVEISIGFTPIFSLGLAPRFRAHFSNSTKPVIP